MENKLGQVSIFIIIAVVIVAAIAGYFIFRNSISSDLNVPASIEPVYNTFLTCIEEDILTGVDVLESQGGYIDLPNFEPGSAYMPFSSQLNFLGNPIPYWYYVSGNNIQREKIPTRNEMENSLEKFVEEKINNCVFEEYYEEGFEIEYDELQADINIKEEEIEVDFEINLNIQKGEESAFIDSSRVVVNSQLGRLYEDALKVYEQEQEELFLETYAVDVLRLYAPVDGVELSCSPLVWNGEEVFDELREAIEINTLALRTSGGDDEYFNLDLDVDSEVRFINDRNWANGFEVNPTEGSVLISKPVGNQPGLGILGFCYVPYHFVYNLKYPVLIQVYSQSLEEGDEEVFQFPVAVILQGNQPREALEASAVGIGVPELCDNKNTMVQVGVYDTNLNPIEADISYGCFGITCEIGKTESGALLDLFPQCVNGFISAKADGFRDAKEMYSVVQSSEAEIIMDRLYELEVELNLENKNYGGEAILNFISDTDSQTIIYPEQTKVKLSGGQYEIAVYVYEDSEITLQETNYEQCIEVPKSGLGALFDLTEEECFDINIPSQIVSSALAGGGKESYYILEEELENSESIRINADSLPNPKNIEDLQNNYILFETKDLGIDFK